MNAYRIEKILDHAYYTEGPVVGPDGSLYVTTLQGGEVIRIERTGAYRTWAKGHCPNGQVLAGDGRHRICESLSGRVTVYTAEGEFESILIDRVCATAPVTAPNDLILSKNGDLYFTDSVREQGKVFFAGSNGEQRIIAGEIDYANGLALDPAEERLYVAESYANRILVIDLRNNRYSKEILADLPAHVSGDPVKNLPDGLAVDAEGRIWVAHYGMQAIQVLSGEGGLLFTLDTRLPLTSNLAFIRETPDHKEILITGGYGEPGPGAVMKADVLLGVKDPPEGYTSIG